MEKIKADLVGFIDFFKEVPDHRINRRKLHSVEEILLLTFCGVVGGCDSWNDIERKRSRNHILVNQCTI